MRAMAAVGSELGSATAIAANALLWGHVHGQVRRAEREQVRVRGVEAVGNLAVRLRSARAGEAHALEQVELQQEAYHAKAAEAQALEAALRAERLRSETLLAELRAVRSAHAALQADHAYIVEAYVP